MELPDDVKQAGVKGATNANALLQQIAIESLRQLAGYTPSTLPDNVHMRRVHDSRPVTPTRATSQLYRMLPGDFQFGQCLPEWCLLVSEHGMRVPPELIPAVLNSKQLFTGWREVVLLAMGSYARWIVAHQYHSGTTGHWSWVRETPTPTLAWIHQEIVRRSQDKIEEYERTRNISTFHSSLANYQFFWTDDLTEIVLRHIDYLIDNISSDRWRLDMHRIHQCFAYYAPLKYHETYDKHLQRMREMKLTTIDIAEITVYRHKLQRLIAEDAAQIVHRAGGAD